MVQPVRKAVFPVAGLGTRFLPATKVMPKEMLPIVDKPLIQYALEEAQEAGIKDFVLVTGRGKNLMEDHFDNAYELEAILIERGKEAELDAVQRMMPDPGKLAYTRQRRPLGLGHAIWCARQFIAGEPFAVLLPDDLIQAGPGCLKQMMDAYAEVGGNIVAVEDVPREHTNRYGILDVESEKGALARARGLVEKPDPASAPSTLSIIGRYILQPEVFEHLDKHETGAGDEIQLTDAMAKTIGDIPFHGMRFEGRRFDCGTKIGFVAANVAFAVARDDLNGDIREVIKSII
ncbi:MAG: UTP--glucose-1-phosphate uridylyltransferase GalU [Rhodospirillaceae bacterium]|mgnify:FL=1|nr:UTP--glucose-1-phosphate uridylyltransferase GalU [Rhodospirillaceae bacterium]